MFKDNIFEGSQGILLDMDFGIFPNVTRSNTTSKNALEIIQRNSLNIPEIIYITRAYQTRHGNGWMSNESDKINVSNPLETNVTGEWQGHFRKGLLDFDMINYAMQSDNNFSDGLVKHIAVTCCDQLEGNLKAICDGKQVEILNDADFLYKLTDSEKMSTIKKSFSDCSDNMTSLDYFDAIKENNIFLKSPINEISYQTNE